LIDSTVPMVTPPMLTLARGLRPPMLVKLAVTGSRPPDTTPRSVAWIARKIRAAIGQQQKQAGGQFDLV
jgi:hypothetical protein